MIFVIFQRTISNYTVIVNPTRTTSSKRITIPYSGFSANKAVIFITYNIDTIPKLTFTNCTNTSIVDYEATNNHIEVHALYITNASSDVTVESASSTNMCVIGIN